MEWDSTKCLDCGHRNTWRRFKWPDSAFRKEHNRVNSKTCVKCDSVNVSDDVLAPMVQDDILSSEAVASILSAPDEDLLKTKDRVTPLNVTKNVVSWQKEEVDFEKYTFDVEGLDIQIRVSEDGTGSVIFVGGTYAFENKKDLWERSPHLPFTVSLVEVKSLPEEQAFWMKVGDQEKDAGFWRCLCGALNHDLPSATIKFCFSCGDVCPDD